MKRVILAAKAKLREQYIQDMLSAEFTEDGMIAREEAARRYSVLDEITLQLRETMREEL